MQKLLTATKNTYTSYKSYRNDNEQKQSGKSYKSCRNDNEQKQSGHQSISLKCMGVSGCAFCMAGSSISRPPHFKTKISRWAVGPQPFFSKRGVGGGWRWLRNVPHQRIQHQQQKPMATHYTKLPRPLFQRRGKPSQRTKPKGTYRTDQSISLKCTSD